VLVYDHVGTGRSTRVGPDALSIEGMASDVLAVMDAAGFAHAHVVGHAIGGIVGLALALRAPARLRSLVLVNAWARADAHLRRCFDVRREILRASGPAAYVRAQPLFLYPPRWIAENDATLEAEAVGMVAGFPATEVMLRRIEMFLAFDAVERLGAVATPTLVVASLDDTLVPPEQSRRLAAGIAHARLVEFAYGGHASSAVEPAAFNHAVGRFLRDVDDTA
jgi:aminoacrylate hydrolase